MQILIKEREEKERTNWRERKRGGEINKLESLDE
jgi:hypothetical protein